MTFSIIVPVYNGEKFIETSVNSALNQDYSGEYEIILLENGSTDNTSIICDDYAGKNSRIRSIHRGKIGLYMARQEGIRASKGDYIVALDADDFLRPEALSTLDNYIRFLKDKDYDPDLIFYNAADMDDREVPFGKFSFESKRTYSGDDKKAFKDLLCAGDSLNAMWIKCIKRTIADVGIDKNGLNYGEDLFQTAVYVDKAQEIAYLDKVLYYYRDNSESLTSTYNKAFMDNQEFVWSNIDSIADKWGDPSYKTQIDLRKTLTCAIAVAKIIYSDMAMKEKKEKLCSLMESDFYRIYARRKLPAWAPEEDVFVHGLMMEDEAEGALLHNAWKYNFKKSVKKLLKME